MPSKSNVPDELRRSFERRLPKRIAVIRRRVGQFQDLGWDINELSLLLADAQRLAGASGRHGLIEASEQLLALEDLLGRSLASDVLPDAPTRASLARVLDRLQALYPLPEEGDPAEVPTSGDLERLEVPPAEHWQRWSADAEPPAQAAATGSGDAAPAGSRAQQVKPERRRKPPQPRGTRTPLGPPEAGPEAPPAAAKPAPAGTFRIYHLTDASAASLLLSQHLEAAGYEVEPLSDPEELREVLSALPPDLLLIDARFSDQLEGIGASLLPARQHNGAPLPLVALAEHDGVELRLAARRARVDALLIAPPGVDPVLRQIKTLLTPPEEPAYRVLIVEDDRSQGIFAESILRNAGMDAQVVEDPLAVLPLLEMFHPDLVLMDLHMPKANGMELTALIRERDDFLETPIVFLSGESDQDLQFEALEAGGDDFIAKPVRPRHLIAAVQNRIRRARSASRRQQRVDLPDPGTGLYRREWLLERIDDAIDQALSTSGDRVGGVLFLEIEGALQIRERLGLSALERLLAIAGRVLSDKLGTRAWACRFGDSSFLVLAPERSEDEVESLGIALRALLAAHPFDLDGNAMRLRPAVGVCAFSHGFADAGALLTAVERACRTARGSERGVQSYVAPRRPEAEREQALIALLRHAIEHGAFELLYQPIVAVQGGEEAQYQTLLRMRDEHGELYSATDIIPIAERADLIVDTDRWVLDHALGVIAQRRELAQPVRLFVSQAGATLAKDEQAAWLAHRLGERDLHGDCLVIEVRLADAMVYASALRTLGNALRELGVQLCLSRFERGPDADRLFDSLPLGYVKLARKYLAANSTQAVRDELRLLIDDLHRHGIKVIGHRVEDAQAAATLWMTGIDYIQGNLVQEAESNLDFDFHSAVL